MDTTALSAAVKEVFAECCGLLGQACTADDKPLEPEEERLLRTISTVHSDLVQVYTVLHCV